MSHQATRRHRFEITGDLNEKTRSGSSEIPKIQLSTDPSSRKPHCCSKIRRSLTPVTRAASHLLTANPEHHILAKVRVEWEREKGKTREGKGEAPTAPEPLDRS